jgi:Uma2 family endonuclease
MGILQKQLDVITADEYLSIERQAEERNEFYRGETTAMAGGSRWHNILAGQIYAALVNHLDGKPCTPYMADMRLCIEAHQHYVYPDVLVVCQEEPYITEDMVKDATVIIEVLSPSTESYDRGRKFLHYQSLSSLQEYVIITQEMVQVEIFRRREKHKWEYELLNEPDDEVNLEAVQFSMTLTELYKNIRLSKINSTISVDDA